MISKKIQINELDKKLLDHFLEVIRGAMHSKYINEAKGTTKLTISFNAGEPLRWGQSFPEPECTTYFLTQIRVCLLAKEDVYYEKVAKVLYKISNHESSIFKKRHGVFVSKIRDIIQGSEQNEMFNLFMYGKYAKKDLSKKEVINSFQKEIRALGEVAFHNELQRVFDALCGLANLYAWCEKQYEFHIVNLGKKPTIPPRIRLRL